MGDRAVFGFRENSQSPTIYIYSHWGGSTQDSDLAKALAVAEPRWADPDYATRICISQLIGDYWIEETGYGLSVGRFVLPDYDYVNVVDWAEQRVHVYTYVNDGDWESRTSFTINDFIVMELKKLLVTP